MKKVFAVLCVLFLASTLVSCYSKEDLAIARSEGYDAGYTEGRSAGIKDGYNKGYVVGFDEGHKNAMSELILSNSLSSYRPDSGEILSGQEYYTGSEITVTADSKYDYAVSLKNIKGEERICFYVRAGDTVTVCVPSEYLCVYFASGTNWQGYGKGKMFGANTVYSKDDDLLDFTQYTWEYTLVPMDDGNFSETPSDESEFFK